MDTQGRRIAFPLFALACVIALSLAATNVARSIEPQIPASVQVHLRDYCDPVTFNATVGAGDCIGPGLMPIDFFFGELGQEKSVGEWRFNPDTVQAEEGTKLVLVNSGGETHTFTRVEKFGGGFVAPLNALSGTLVPAPECALVLPNGDLVPQPESPTNQFVEAGTTEQGPTIRKDDREIKYMCCVHPWMRFVLNPKDADHKNDGDQN